VELARELLLNFNVQFNLVQSGITICSCPGIEYPESTYSEYRTRSSTEYAWCEQRGRMVSPSCMFYVVAETQRGRHCERAKTHLDALIKAELALTPRRSRTVRESWESPSSRVRTSRLSRDSLIARYNNLASRHKAVRRKYERLLHKLSSYRDAAVVSMLRISSNYVQTYLRCHTERRIGN
jgi:hypothetical protein